MLQPYCDVCNRDGQCIDCSITMDSETGAYTLVGKTCKPCGVLNCERCVAGKPGVCGVCQDGYFVADGGRRCRKVREQSASSYFISVEHAS